MIYPKSEILFQPDESIYNSQELFYSVIQNSIDRQSLIMMRTGQTADLLIVSPFLFAQLQKLFMSQQRIIQLNKATQYLSIQGNCGVMRFVADNRLKNVLMATNSTMFSMWWETEAHLHQELISDNYLYKIVDQAFEDIVLGE